MRTTTTLRVLFVLAVTTVAACTAPSTEDDGNDRDDVRLGVSRSALPIVSVEAELFTSGMYVINDPQASAQKAMFFRPSFPVSKSVSFPSATTKLTVRARGDQCEGAPILNIQVSGAPQKTITVAASQWTDYTIALPVTAGNHSVTMAFFNDKQTKSCTRKLYADKLEFATDDIDPPPPPPPTQLVIEGETMAMPMPDATASQNQYGKMRSADTTQRQFGSPQVLTTLTVRARAVVCAQPTPHMELKVDGVSIINTDVAQSSWTDFTAAIPALPTGNHTVQLLYTNDTGATNCDASLHIDKLTFALTP
jgi:hypothetical protein